MGSHGFHGPRCWALSAGAGAALGVALSPLLSGPGVPAWLVAPFVLLLLSIAVVPLASGRFWHDHFPDFAFFFGAVVFACYLAGFGRAGATEMLHVGHEYFSFIALVGGLYVVSGGIHISVRARGAAPANTALLAAGALLANVVGTTGASVLLIRPFIAMNRGRLVPQHVVMFILIVSNCGGCLTPIGDPPLYLGFLKGVPFHWTILHLWNDWALATGLLLAIFYFFDRRIPAGDRPPGRGVAVRGVVGIVGTVLVVAGVFIDPLLNRLTGLDGVPIGALFQCAVAATAWRLAPPDIHGTNGFTLFPVKEVGILFAGIFVTMAPAVAYLAAHGQGLGLRSATHLYFATGTLSAVLDNAPTYLNFLQVALGDAAVTPETLGAFLQSPRGEAYLTAISTGAVFFGALTYIGNGPNFMVKSIAERDGVRMPSFAGYIVRAAAVLVPVLFVHWAALIR